MGKTLDLGRRVELQSADKHCDDISVALYQREVDGLPRFLVHTYAHGDAAAQRVAFLREALASRLGMERAAEDADWLLFPCGAAHLRALKRAFLDLTKLVEGESIEPLPLTVFDKKADGNVMAKSLGEGVYQITAESDGGAKRTKPIARGFAKLCEMEEVEGQETEPGAARFACGQSHDAMIGQLMYRAQNVRAAMAEDEQAASRGVLSAPSAQQP